MSLFDANAYSKFEAQCLTRHSCKPDGLYAAQWQASQDADLLAARDREIGELKKRLASHTAQESRGDRERFLKLWQFAFACAGAGVEVDGIDASDLCRDVARSMDPDSIVAQMEAWNLEAEALPSVVPPVPQTVNVEEEA